MPLLLLFYLEYLRPVTPGFFLVWFVGLWGTCLRVGLREKAALNFPASCWEKTALPPHPPKPTQCCSLAEDPALPGGLLEADSKRCTLHELGLREDSVTADRSLRETGGWDPQVPSPPLTGPPSPAGA